MRIEVIYALAHEQLIFEVHASGVLSVREAIRRSGVLERYPELELEKLHVGIYSETVTLDTRLEDEDRVEIYRPLTLSPIEARRIRAEKKRRANQTRGKLGA